MASMFPSAEHSVNPSSLPSYNPLYATNQSHALIVHKNRFKNKEHTIPELSISQWMSHVAGAEIAYHS